jgi:hypothetical protein
MPETTTGTRAPSQSPRCLKCAIASICIRASPASRPPPPPPMSFMRAALRAVVAPARAAFSTSSPSPRPFKVRGVQQIAIGGENKAVMPPPSPSHPALPAM